MAPNVNHTSRPLLISTSDLQGGAARAAYRLHRGLIDVGVDSEMLCFYRTSGDRTVSKLPNSWRVQRTKLAMWADKQPLKLYPQRDKVSYWSLNWVPDGQASLINRFDSNIAHLHWVGNGFLPVGAVKKLKQKIVWTLHDMWAFTGGCHYSGECSRYEEGCGNCPQLNSHSRRDISRFTIARKQRLWHGTDIVVVTPSQWLADCAHSSQLFCDNRIEVIPNGIDTGLYKPRDTATARDMLGLPQGKKLILAGAHEGLRDRRKGVQYLMPAIRDLSEKYGDDAALVVFGTGRPEDAPNFGMKTYYTGHLHDDVSLVLLYSAVDVFVAPSLQDNLPNTIMESLACGTPCVGFNIGGIPDMIDHQVNGYIAKPFDVDDLRDGIAWILDDSTRYKKLSEAGRDSVVRKYTIDQIARQYNALYQEILGH